MAEKLQELIEKYEDEINKLKEYLELESVSTHEWVSCNIRIDDYQKFVDELEVMLNTSF